MRAAFLDRDGVINHDYGYVYLWEHFTFIEGAITAMQCLNKQGYEIVIVTNQSGIARGKYTEAQFLELTHKMLEHLRNKGVKILDVLYCPHHPDGLVKEYSIECECRKPKAGMLIEASNKYSINLSKSILVGDKYSDIAAARSAGIRSAYHIRSNNPGSSSQAANADKSFNSLEECVRWMGNNITLKEN